MIFRKMGFHEKWVILMMRCITFVAYSIHINENLEVVLLLLGVLHQRDPLFPYLFLLCVESLSSFIQKAMEVKAIEGVSISHWVTIKECMAI